MRRHDGPAKVGWLARIGDLDRGGERNRHRNACDGGHVMATHSVRAGYRAGDHGGRLRLTRMPIVLPLSAIGTSHLGKPG